ncbi:hypothetical protein C0216_05410 [Streptomyces globosus]|uniref:Uncharacterized protein n=1 Tax=Streptomyces globosus TaxID=68209 RepID=A0A344TWE5_9ACTN|nr:MULTISPECIES: hypothetical protein [Streptomyces]AXE22966.1 hypothetical protein C0216_05410 [Streptomyces globosus]
MNTAGALAGVAVVLAGCSTAPGGGSAASPAGAPPATAAPSTPPAPPEAAPAPDAPSPTAERLVTVTRSGGYAGKTTSLLVKGDGSWARLDGEARPAGSGRLSPEDLAELRAALAAADFPRLPRVSMDGGTVFDGFTYVFVHAGREVATADGSIPAGLRPVLDALPPFEADRATPP